MMQIRYDVHADLSPDATPCALLSRTHAYIKKNTLQYIWSLTLQATVVKFCKLCKWCHGVCISKRRFKELLWNKDQSAFKPKPISFIFGIWLFWKANSNLQKPATLRCFKSFMCNRVISGPSAHQTAIPVQCQKSHTSCLQFLETNIHFPFFTIFPQIYFLFCGNTESELVVSSLTPFVLRLEGPMLLLGRYNTAI